MKKLKRFGFKFFRHIIYGMTHFARGFMGGFFVIITIALALFMLYQYIHAIVSPKIINLVNTAIPESTKLYARDGTLLYEIYSETKRTPVPLSEIAPSLQKATIAIEDKNFYFHKGISLESLVRSAISDAYLKDAAYGGSTITQQLIKNTVLSNKKSISRKLAEIIWALETERYLSKDIILERYLNQIPYGRKCLGVECAAQSYFGKPARELTLAESAYLAAMPQAPSQYNPLGPNRELLDARKNYVLDAMEQQGYISSTEKSQAKQIKVEFKPEVEKILAPHFSLWVKQNLIARFGKDTVEKQGLKVYTTLDLRLQNIAEETVGKYANINSKQYNAYNAALVATNPKSGEVLAMVGSKDYFGRVQPLGCNPGKNCLFEPFTNVATSLRQPGSSFKPYVYATAFGKNFRYTPSSIILDSPTNFSVRGSKPYVPQNYNGRSYGRVPIRKALAGSLNIPAVRMASLIGTESIIQNAKAMGITAPLSNCGLSLALGSCEVSLLDHVTGFGVLAAGGVYNGKTAILTVQDKNGNTLISHEPQNQQVIEPEAAFETVSIMSDAEAREFIFGNSTPLTLPNRPVAAKTGTTQNWKDGWTVGFTPSLAVGVWTGNNDGTLMRAGSDGVFTAAPLWQEFMRQALGDTVAEKFTMPKTVQYLAVDRQTGKVLKDQKAGRFFDYFAEYSLPQAPKPKPKTPIINPEDLDAAEKLRLAEAGIDPNSLLYTPSEEESNILPVAEIISPKENFEIYSLPLNVIVKTSNAGQTAKVELFLDGDFIAESEGPLFLFKLENLPKNGKFMLTARTISREGSYTDSQPLPIFIYLPQNSLQ